MKQQLAHITVLVNDYDESISFYTKKLHFELTADTPLTEHKRWVLVTPKGSSCSLLLAKAADEKQKARVGDQTGGRVFFFLHTDDFERDYQNLLEQQITIIRPPVKEAYGRVAVFEDINGNWWDLIGPA